MAFTDIGSGAGAIYDSNEIVRYNDLLSKIDEEAEKLQNEESKKKDIIRFAIVGAGAILILVAVQLLAKNKKK
jgi:predicted RNase H-related nuclease YkuK (DUF458 family)